MSWLVYVRVAPMYFPPDNDEDLAKEAGEELWLNCNDDAGQQRASEVRGNCSWSTNLIPGACGRRNFLPRLKILVTTLSDSGDCYYKVVESKNRKELKENILRTTWILYLTGWGFHMPTTSTTERDEKSNNQQLVYLDGAFSRTLHPKCEAEWNLPLMWEALFHSFSPGLSRE